MPQPQAVGPRVTQPTFKSLQGSPEKGVQAPICDAGEVRRRARPQTPADIVVSGPSQRRRMSDVFSPMGPIAGLPTPEAHAPATPCGSQSSSNVPALSPSPASSPPQVLASRSSVTPELTAPPPSDGSQEHSDEELRIVENFRNLARRATREMQCNNFVRACVAVDQLMQSAAHYQYDLSSLFRAGTYNLPTWALLLNSDQVRMVHYLHERDFVEDYTNHLFFLAYVQYLDIVDDMLGAYYDHAIEPYLDPYSLATDDLPLYVLRFLSMATKKNNPYFLVHLMQHRTLAAQCAILMGHLRLATEVMKMSALRSRRRAS